MLRVKMIAVATPMLALMLAAEAPGPVGKSRTPELRLTADRTTFPITVVRTYPFIDGSAQGMPGRYLLDTGRRDAFTLNDHRVPLTGGTKIGTGFFGSGQTYDLWLHREVRDVRIGGLRYPVVSDVESQDARQLERITPDFIGWVGYDYFAGRSMKLDYGAARVTFYARGPSDFLRGERVVGVMPLQTRRLPNIPLSPARVGKVEMIANFDTGADNCLYVDEATRKALVQAGNLVPTSDPDEYDLLGVTVGGVRIPDLRSVEVASSPSPAAKPVGVTESAELLLGYSFLRRFKTVWDFRNRRMYLLAT